MKKKKITLVKEKNFFQVLWDKKSVTEFDDDGVKGIEIQGYASTKDKDRGHDIVEPEAFKKALDLYMTNPVVLLQHNMDKPIGVVTEATIDNQGLFIKARITQDIDGVISAIKNGVLRAFSIGFRIKENSFEEYENENGDRDYTNTIKDLELFEISVVSVPMNAYALMKSMQDCFEIKDIEGETEEKEEFENVFDDEKSTTEEAETQETSEEENSSDESEEKVEEKAEDEESETVEEETKSIEGAETTAQTVAESETEATETAEEENTQEDETENDSETEETETKSVENESVEETENQADEKSEIEENQDSDHSENDSESESNDGEVVEEAAKSLKDLQTKSVEKFISEEMKSIEKKLSEQIAEKDAKISELEGKLKNFQELFRDTIEVLGQIDKAVSNTVVKTGYTYQAPQRKQQTSRYGKLVGMLKNI